MVATMIPYAPVRNSTTRLTAAAVKARGWTDTLIRDLLGAPDETKTNPNYRSGPPMRLYNLTRIEMAESSSAWAARTEATERRKEAAARAVETKRTQLLHRLEDVEITLPTMETTELTRLACDHYNQRHFDRGHFASGNASPASDAAFLQRITVNYLRHCLSDYDAELADIFGKVGVREGYREISRKAYAAIGAAYPTLNAECQRQLAAKMC